MSYKTILVHLSDSRRAEAVLEPVTELATRHNSHLIGLHVHAAVPAPPVARTPAVIGAIAAAERKNSDAIAETFAHMTRNREFTAEWQSERVSHVDLAHVVMDRGRAADLIVAAQTDPEWDLAPLMDFPEQLALESGRPVLVIPYAGRTPRIGRHAVVAWKPSREASRAVFDALPLLQDAERVHVLEIKEHADTRPALAPDTSIAAALARHGVKVEVRSTIAADISVGDEILSRSADLGADLLVMGAYGRSRFRELIFGGATRHISRHMTLPTLFSH